MTRDLNSRDMQEIVTRFAGLLRILTHDGETERPADIRDLLIDRLRDALDRRLPSMPESEPSFIGNTFLVEAVVHSNARTIVSRLRHRDLGTWHALKTIGDDRLDDAVAKAMLLREVRIGLALRHANLVAIQCAARLPDSRPAIIAEWAGPPLSQRLSAGDISLPDVRQAMKCLLAGLHAMHEAGYVHGDISPANLLLCDDDFARLKIADFGSATECGKTYGDLDIARAATPGFAAPELSSTEPADPRMDIYAAGCVMKLLLEHCDEETRALSPLNNVAAQLAGHAPWQRPPNAMAALQLIVEN
ncbi:hypothetical protein A6U86_26615 [Rhizobium sp. AC27/96]|nr:hypothetical protein A6U86_26615 [Rhizobium sp. AC27/96]